MKIQGKGEKTDSIRLEGRPSGSPVQQALIVELFLQSFMSNPRDLTVSGIFHSMVLIRKASPNGAASFVIYKERNHKTSLI